MATYKVIQDIEAEDKLIGALTLRQFIYAVVAIFFAYLSFMMILKKVYIGAVLFMPITAVAGFLCWPWSLNQPTEVWALSKIRFILKPHRRIWDQSGTKQLVTITAPKKNERVRTSGLSQTEVRSRLKALADVIDSRGWAIKNVNLNLYPQPLPLVPSEDSDRLIDIASLPQEVPIIDIQSSDDIMDENNPVSQHFDQMISATNTTHHDQIVKQLQEELSRQQSPSGTKTISTQLKTDEPPADYWFMGNGAKPAQIPADNTVFDQQIVAPSPINSAIGNKDDADYKASLIKLKENKAPEPVFARMRHLSLQSPTPKQSNIVPSQPTMTPQPNPAILENVGNNDLSVAVIERLANKQQPEQPPDEVIVPLHH
jgi:hypothetical protein